MTSRRGAASRVEDALAEGFTFVDWLTAVGRTYRDEPGFDVAARVPDVARPGRRRVCA